MIIQKVPHYVDSLLTQEKASSALQGGDVMVAWYTNQLNSQSVVHSHPYYELILPVSGSSVRYSIGGRASLSYLTPTQSYGGISAACWSGWHRPSIWMSRSVRRSSAVR